MAQSLDLKELKKLLKDGWKVKRIASQSVSAPPGASWVRFGGFLVVLEKIENSRDTRNFYYRKFS